MLPRDCIAWEVEKENIVVWTDLFATRCNRAAAMEQDEWG